MIYRFCSFYIRVQRYEVYSRIPNNSVIFVKTSQRELKHLHVTMGSGYFVTVTDCPDPAVILLPNFRPSFFYHCTFWYKRLHFSRGSCHNVTIVPSIFAVFLSFSCKFGDFSLYLQTLYMV